MKQNLLGRCPKGKLQHPRGQCNYASLRPSSLKIHLKIHSGEKENKCTLCNYASSNANSLKLHLETHTGEKSHHCNQCEYKCVDKSALIMHLMKHSGEKSNKCNLCDFASSYASTLRNILKDTVEKSQTNAANVTMPLLRKAI